MDLGWTGDDDGDLGLGRVAVRLVAAGHEGQEDQRCEGFRKHGILILMKGERRESGSGFQA
jgi:hypothetical protein